MNGKNRWIGQALVPLSVLFLYLASAGFGQPSAAGEFSRDWSGTPDRTWAGPDLWANRLQDWQVASGRLECVEGNPAKPMRTVHLLSHRLGKQTGGLRLSVQTGLISSSAAADAQSWTGLLLGAGEDRLDPRAAALVHHTGGEAGGIVVALDGAGKIVFRDMAQEEFPVLAAGPAPEGFDLPRLGQVTLEVDAVAAGGGYRLVARAADSSGRRISEGVLENVPGDRLVGNVALVSHPGPAGARYWFGAWAGRGDKLEQLADGGLGPIFGTQYTLSRGILKMTAQLAPLGAADTATARLEIRDGSQWREAAVAPVIAPGWTATFRIENWESDRDLDYRVVYALKTGRGERDYAWSGTVRREPLREDELSIAVLNCNHNTGNDPPTAWGGVEGWVSWTHNYIWFPHQDLVDRLTVQRPDLYFFAGDQIYESDSPTAVVREPEDKAMLDYLYKWYLWCWAFRDLTRDTPAVTIPDDHDVFHGNIWGDGGKPPRKLAPGQALPPGSPHEFSWKQDGGGYAMSADWLNMMQRTQTSHLPDPYDPTPALQGIEVYYCDMNYGGISFAVLEDRKFKSPPSIITAVPAFNGWVRDTSVDPRLLDVPGANLLGDRQHRFLDAWTADWSGGAQMKVVLTQTMFANVSTDHGGDYTRLRADCDSNGWPQSGRNEALRILRKGYAFMICGDQHLSTIVQHGVDAWNDSVWQFCGPSLANYYPRKWDPGYPGANRQPDRAPYTGEYIDGFGNLVTVWAASNPEDTPHEPSLLHDKAVGYGIVRLNKADRTITMECWPRYADPRDPQAKQYPGWPFTISMEDNYGREAVAYLPTLRISGMEDAVVQVIDEFTSETVYTLRINGTEFRPKVFRPGSYRVVVGEPGTERVKVLEKCLARSIHETAFIDVSL